MVSSLVVALFLSPTAHAGFNEDVGAVIQSHINVKTCADMLLKIKEPGKSHDEFELLISKEGKLLELTVNSKTPGMETYVACLKEEFKSVQFPISPKKKDYRHKTAIDWNFQEEGTPGAVPGDMTVQTNDEVIKRQEEVQSHVYKSKDSLWACYKDYKGRYKQQAKSGTITLSWTVYGTGMASKVVVNNDEFGDAKLSSCVREVINRMKFPAPPGSVVVEIDRFPISFTKKK
ncbi:AgmX/PglI C-terminal domain-containing protein [Bdellovibrio sp. HCB2-146]|uniref:AgmX/PglI C-terminal domain-containing protein n=1 Tax=Bdellovibrio sp. HCB2-146 TaxID=3394362 RepID=UPI0039BCF764